jgi:hypothetical protein
MFRSDMQRLFLLPLALCLSAAAQPAPTQPAPAPALTYADLADLALPAPVVAHVQLRRAIPVRPEQAAGVRAGHTRFYVEAQALSLIRGVAGTPTELRYVVDLPNGADGRPARPARRSEWLVFAREVPGRIGELQLVARDALIPYAPATADRVRAILREALTADAPPALTAIGRAFHVPGALPGTGETQIFLQTSQNQPISLTIARETGGAPRWSVSLSEFVDAGATQPAQGSLLWYRLACFLPERLPPASTADAGEHRAAVAADYEVVRAGLGPCPRSRAR